jgi:adenylate kinase
LYLVLLGAPGSGKGTQAVTLSQSLGLPHVATGDLFREQMSQGTEVGLLAKEYVDKGQLVPDQVTIRMLLERLGKPDSQRGAILDGFPRTVEQATALDTALGQQGKSVDKAILLEVSEEELLRRLSGRWICSDCQTPYHEASQPPRVAGICDRCGGKLYQRADDTRETAERRLKVYAEQTMPLIDYYRKQNRLVTVTGEGPVEDVGVALAAAAGGTRG